MPISYKIHYLQDDRISFRDKGILTCLILMEINKDNDMEILNSLSSITKDRIENIHSGILELKKYGYFYKSEVEGKKVYEISKESTVVEWGE